MSIQDYNVKPWYEEEFQGKKLCDLSMDELESFIDGKKMNIVFLKKHTWVSIDIDGQGYGGRSLQDCLQTYVYWKYVRPIL